MDYMHICRTCSKTYVFTQKDSDFYQLMDFPLPKDCPACRYQRRLVFRNERTLYKRTCTATGKQIVSIFSEEKPLSVYCSEYWWSDKWSAWQYGRDFDFNLPFFEQFKELFYQVPQLTLFNSGSENCEFTNQAQHNRNCYLIVASDHNQDCMYGMWFSRCRDSLDCVYLEESELCYEIVNGTKCYRCMFSQNIEQCSDVHYSKNLIGCHDCIGCINLRNKQYYIFNQPYSREDYYKALPLITEKFQNIRTFFLEFPHKYYVGRNNFSFSGDYLQDTKNSFDAYNCRYAEDINYCYDAWKANNCRDLTETFQNEECMQLEGCEWNVDSAFGMKLVNVSASRYCSHCFYSQHLFGCVGMRNAEFCVLNKQYSKEQYHALVSRIVEHMKKTGEWGEYFPASISPFGYNETVAQEYFPLTRQQVMAQGYTWKEDMPVSHGASEQQVVFCEVTGKPFRLVRAELEFYNKMSLALPKRCPDQRHRDRMNLRNPRVLHDRVCQQCQKPLQSTYAKSRLEIVYCEECYCMSL